MGKKRFIADPSPWTPITEAQPLRVLGKFLEEVCEATESIAWLLNRQSAANEADLAKEIADVWCNLALVAENFGLVYVAPTYSTPFDDPLHEFLARLGHAGSAAARCIIQGVDEVEPSTKVPNRDWLSQAIRDLFDSVGRVIAHRNLDMAAITERRAMKREHLLRWHQMESGT